MANPVVPEISSEIPVQTNPRRSIVRKAVYVVGSIFFALSIFYIGATISKNWSAILTHDWRGLNYSWLALAAVTYGCSLITTAMVWPSVIAKWGHKIKLRTALAIGLVTQIGKYLPGNVAHYFGRAALAKHHKISFTQSGLSTIVEFGAALSAAALVAIGATIFDSSVWARAPIVSILPRGLFWPLVMLTMIFVAGITAFALRRLPEIRRLVAIDFWMAPIFWLTISFLMAGFSFYALANAVSGDWSISVTPAIAIYTIAWAAGFVIPGAPAGLGVREVILLTFLLPIIGAPGAVMLSLAHRLLSAIIDSVVAALATTFLLKKEPSHAS